MLIKDIFEYDDFYVLKSGDLYFGKLTAKANIVFPNGEAISKKQRFHHAVIKPDGNAKFYHTEVALGIEVDLKEIA